MLFTSFLSKYFEAEINPDLMNTHMYQVCIYIYKYNIYINRKKNLNENYEDRTLYFGV